MKLRKVLVALTGTRTTTFTTTSTDRVFRYEVPIIKKMHRGAKLRVTAMPPEAKSLGTGEVDDLASEVARLRRRWGKNKRGEELFDLAYPDIEDFREAFEATIRRDAFDKNAKVNLALPEIDPEEASPLEDIHGVGAPLAQALEDAGFKTIQDVAQADPDDLESIDGIGPATAPRIIASAKALLN